MYAELSKNKEYCIPAVCVASGETCREILNSIKSGFFGRFSEKISNTQLANKFSMYYFPARQFHPMTVVQYTSREFLEECISTYFNIATTSR